jgi:hypothetical protein
MRADGLNHNEHIREYVTPIGRNNRETLIYLKPNIIVNTIFFRYLYVKDIILFNKVLIYS